MTFRKKWLPILLLLLLLASSSAGAAPPSKGNPDQGRHPLDPLTAEEIQTAVAVFGAAGATSADTLFAALYLHEPPKAEVLAWKPGQPMRREAFAIIYDRENGQTAETVADVVNGKLLSHRIMTDVEPSVLMEEYDFVPEIIKSDPGFLEAIERRGITDLDKVQFDVWAPGYYGIPDEEGKRILRAPVFYTEDPTNLYARPIEGLVIYMDPVARQVHKLVDTGVVPLPPNNEPLDAKSTRPHRRTSPLKITQPQGAGFRVLGQQVTWQNWQFRWSVHPRQGLTLHTVGYKDAGKVRPIMYSGFLSEMVVPYADPDETFFWRNAFDVGEYNLGLNAHLLEAGRQCPTNAALFDAVFADELGEPYVQERAVCIFERDGDLAWTHYDMAGGETNTRRAQQLVIRFLSVIGNYDYGLDWVFHPDGTLEQVTTATGILEPKAVHAKTMAEDQYGHESEYGAFVGEHVVAPNHQHFFNFRLDLDVDGTTNSVVETNVSASLPSPTNPWKNAFTATETLLADEASAQRDLSMQSHREWKVVSNRTNGLGAPTGYKIEPSENAVPYADPSAWVRKRAGFLDHHLWVTPFSPTELYAAGDYPNQSQGGDGIPMWTAANRIVRNTDVVLWYTMGLTHIPRPEEWPVMPGHRIGFKLKPVHFFSRNPAMDLPEYHGETKGVWNLTRLR